MATKKLTDADIRNAKAKSGQRLELWDTHTPGLCLRVTPGRKVWVVRYRVDGKQRRFVLGEYPADLDLTEARPRAALILQGARKKGDDPAGAKARAKAEARAQPIKTFRDLAEAYVAACQKGQWKPRGKPQSARTLRDARESLDRYILPELGDLRLREMSRAVVRTFMRDMAARGIGAQTNAAVGLIRRVYSWAIVEFEGKLVAVNVGASHPRETEAPRSRVLTDAELKGVWTALKEPAGLKLPAKEGAEPEPLHLSRPMAILLQLAALLLQRPNEIAGMTAAELNLHQKIWLIPPQRMKSRKAHLVPLPPKAVELIREAVQLAELARPKPAEGEKPASDFPVFSAPRDRSRPIRTASATHAMRDVLRAIGQDDVILYDLRRTGSTALTSERIGVTHFVRSLVLSHTTDAGGGAAVSARHYDANAYVAEKRRALEAWEGLLLEIVGEKPRGSNVEPMVRSA